MSSKHVRGPMILDEFKLVLAGNYTIINESLVIVNKTVGAATQITLPPSVSAVGRRIINLVDGKGDAATNAITVVPNGTDTINGGASAVFAVNNVYVVLVDLGGGAWVSAVPPVSGAGSFTTLSLTGLLTESSGDTLTAVGTNQATALQLTKQVNRITTGASTTGVLLPLASAAQPIMVINSVANSIHVYGSGTDTINGVATATGVVQPGNTACLYVSTTTAPAGKYFVTIPLTAAATATVQGTLTTVGAGTILAATIAGKLLLRTGATSAFTDTTDTGTLIAAAIPGIGIGQSFEWTYQNSTPVIATLTGGTGVNGAATFATVGPGSWVRVLFTYTAANTFSTVVINAGGDIGGIPPYKLSTGTTTTTFTAAEMVGAKFTVYRSTAATPGSIATATATAMFAAIPGAYVGQQWLLRIINGVATNSMTITADASVTLSGKTTFVLTPFEFQDYLMTFLTATTASMQFVGGGVGSTA